MQTSSDTPAAPKRQLTLFDSTCIIVGIIIGAGVYQTAPSIACGVNTGLKQWGETMDSLAQWAAQYPSWLGWLAELAQRVQHIDPWIGVCGIWIVGGLLSLCGAMAYAELATAYPRAGGDYVYLTKAYGPWAGFMFGWLQLLVVRPADIVTMAFAFATFGVRLWNPLEEFFTPANVQKLYAGSAVVLFTLLNIIGVSEGKWAQNVLTVAKALGILAIVVVAFTAPQQAGPAEPVELIPLPLTVALILVLFAYGGWNEMAYVAAEVKNPDRNIVRALLLGTGSVVLLYVLLNAAFMYALGFTGLASSKAVAADAIAGTFPNVGERLISALVCISALGAVNGLILTGARISYAVGADHRLFRFVGKWNQRTGTPLRALVLQGAIALALIILLGSFIEAVIYAAATVYLFYLATSWSVIVLRVHQPQVPRAYRLPAYPVPILVFAGVCLFLMQGAINYRPLLSFVALGIAFLGLPVYWLTTPRNQRADAS